MNSQILATETTMRPVLKEVNFDGFNFWLRDIRIGRIHKDWQLCSPIPSDVMRDEKLRCLGKILRQGDTL